ncbi:hypothetical protein GLR21_RS27500, partial [Escherichia coli]
YFFRNAMFLLQQNYVPLYSKIRLLTGMCNRILSVALMDESKLDSYIHCIRGIKDGVKLGKNEKNINDMH